MATTGSQTTNPAGSPKVSPLPASDKPEQFQAFESLTRKLTKVSKDELDEKRRES